MNRLLHAWREFGDRVLRLLVGAFAILAILTGLDLPSVGGPRWLSIAFIVFGLALLAFNVLDVWRRRRRQVEDEAP
ncbi:MAG TPA: hypothetical protein PLH94_05220 [Fimbriimonadaceae bacterium]|nr:hypothetical protein [Fimbriimonadaceae bacterium]